MMRARRVPPLRTRRLRRHRTGNAVGCATNKRSAAWQGSCAAAKTIEFGRRHTRQSVQNGIIHMNKTILTVAVSCLALGGLSGIASAHEEDEQPPQVIEQGVQYGRPVYQANGQDPRYDRESRRDDDRVFDRRSGGDGLGREVDHLNRMLQHVEREMRRYRADRHIRGEFQHLRAEAYQLDNQFRRGAQFYDARRLRAQIAHMHDELHHIEEELHVPVNEFFAWR